MLMVVRGWQTCVLTNHGNGNHGYVIEFQDNGYAMVHLSVRKTQWRIAM